MHALTSDFLDNTYQSSTFIETMRWIGIILAANLAIWSLVRFLQHERFWSAISMGSLGLLACLQEIESLGEPFYPWRLPLLLLATVAGLRYMYYSADEIKRGPSR
jgi:hypothetical protein